MCCSKIFTASVHSASQMQLACGRCLTKPSKMSCALHARCEVDALGDCFKVCLVTCTVLAIFDLLHSLRNPVRIGLGLVWSEPALRVAVGCNAADAPIQLRFAALVLLLCRSVATAGVVAGRVGCASRPRLPYPLRLVCTVKGR
jgi:hypothetical protein